LKGTTDDAEVLWICKLHPSLEDEFFDDKDEDDGRLIPSSSLGLSIESPREGDEVQ
jgi:hypothetical protein